MANRLRIHEWKNFNWRKPIKFHNANVDCPNYKYKGVNILFFNKWSFVFNEKVWTYPQRTFEYNTRSKTHKVADTKWEEFNAFI